MRNKLSAALLCLLLIVLPAPSGVRDSEVAPLLADDTVASQLQDEVDQAPGFDGAAQEPLEAAPSMEEAVQKENEDEVEEIGEAANAVETNAAETVNEEEAGSVQETEETEEEAGNTSVDGEPENMADKIAEQVEQESVSYSLTLNQTSLPLDMDDMRASNLMAQLLPQMPLDAEVIYLWSSSDPAVAMVSDVGPQAQVTAIQGGTTTVTVSVSSKAWPGDLIASCDVTVHEPIDTLVFSTQAMTLTADKNEDFVGELICRALPETHTDVITWSVEQDGGVIAFDAGTGQVRALKAGTAMITASTRGGLSAQCKVLVRAPQQEPARPMAETSVVYRAVEETMALSPEELLAMSPLESMRLQREALAERLDGGKIFEETSSAVAEPPSEPRQYVRFGADESAVGIRVNEDPVALHAAVFNKDGTTAKQPLTWASSDRKVARVDENGVVTPVRVGKAVITATSSGGASASCYITVHKSAALSAKLLTKAPLKLRLGKTQRVNVGFSPIHGYATLRWSSADPSVAAVDPLSGLITPVGKGETVVSAVSPDLPDVKLSLQVEISAPITSMEMYSAGTRDDGSWLTRPGQTRVLYVDIQPEWEETSDTVVWTSSAPKVASVNKETGEVTALKPGKAIITAKASSGLKATCAVRVVLPADGVTLPDAEIVLAPGATWAVRPELTPENNTDVMSWRIADPGVALVSEAGEVRGIARGHTTLIGTTVGGLTISCLVTVK